MKAHIGIYGGLGLMVSDLALRFQGFWVLEFKRFRI